MDPEPLDYVWITCIIMVNVLFFIRKGILADHGHRTPYIDTALRDRKLFRELAEKEASPLRRRCYHLLNNSIPILFILGVLLLILARVPLGGQ